MPFLSIRQIICKITESLREVLSVLANGVSWVGSAYADNAGAVPL